MHILTEHGDLTMFKKHQTKIGNACISSPEVLADTMICVINSIRTHWYLVGGMNKDVKKNGLDSRYMRNAVKAKAYKYIHRNKKDIYAKFIDYQNGKIDLPDLLLYVASCPNLGLAKAGFVIQLVLGEIGCLDSHNLARFGLSAGTFKYGANASYALMRKKAELYIDTCHKLGGCEYLWDTWCKYLATVHPTKYRDGFEVSRMHVDFILGE